MKILKTDYQAGASFGVVKQVLRPLSNLINNAINNAINNTIYNASKRNI